MRVFVAVDLPAPVRDVMADAVAPVRAAWPSLGWVAPERWHLTAIVLVHSVIGPNPRHETVARLPLRSDHHHPARSPGTIIGCRH